MKERKFARQDLSYNHENGVGKSQSSSDLWLNIYNSGSKTGKLADDVVKGSRDESAKAYADNNNESKNKQSRNKNILNNALERKTGQYYISVKRKIDQNHDDIKRRKYLNAPQPKNGSSSFSSEAIIDDLNNPFFLSKMQLVAKKQEQSISPKNKNISPQSGGTFISDNDFLLKSFDEVNLLWPISEVKKSDNQKRMLLLSDSYPSLEQNDKIYGGNSEEVSILAAGKSKTLSQKRIPASDNDPYFRQNSEKCNDGANTEIIDKTKIVREHPSEKKRIRIILLFFLLFILGFIGLVLALFFIQSLSSAASQITNNNDLPIVINSDINKEAIDGSDDLREIATLSDSSLSPTQEIINSFSVNFEDDNAILDTLGGQSNGPSSVLLLSSVPSSLPSSALSILSSSLLSQLPSSVPSLLPSSAPSLFPSSVSSPLPSTLSSLLPSGVPSLPPSSVPSPLPSNTPSQLPSSVPSLSPSSLPSLLSSDGPSTIPSSVHSRFPSNEFSAAPSNEFSAAPSSKLLADLSTLPSSFPSIGNCKKQNVVQFYDFGFSGNVLVTEDAVLEEGFKRTYNSLIRNSCDPLVGTAKIVEKILSNNVRRSLQNSGRIQTMVKYQVLTEQTSEPVDIFEIVDTGTFIALFNEITEITLIEVYQSDIPIFDDLSKNTTTESVMKNDQFASNATKVEKRFVASSPEFIPLELSQNIALNTSQSAEIAAGADILNSPNHTFDTNVEFWNKSATPEMNTMIAFPKNNGTQKTEWIIPYTIDTDISSKTEFNESATYIVSRSHQWEWSQIGEGIFDDFGIAQTDATVDLDEEGTTVSLTSSTSSGNKIHVHSLDRKRNWTSCGKFYIQTAASVSKLSALVYSRYGPSFVASFGNDDIKVFKSNDWNLQWQLRGGHHILETDLNTAGLTSISLAGDGNTFAISSLSTNKEFAEISVFVYDKINDVWHASSLPVRRNGIFKRVSVAISDNGLVLALCLENDNSIYNNSMEPAESNDDNYSLSTTAASIEIFHLDKHRKWLDSRGQVLDFEVSPVSFALSSKGSRLAVSTPLWSQVFRFHSSSIGWVKLGRAPFEGGSVLSLSRNGHRVAVATAKNITIYYYDAPGSNWDIIGYMDITAMERGNNIVHRPPLISLSGNGKAVAVGLPNTNYQDDYGVIKIYQQKSAVP